jgi:adenine-specific DNA-methyltransferase
MALAFHQQPLLTCIGNKRKLVEPIVAVVREVTQRLGKERLHLVDACTGSGVVARYLLPLAEVLYVNDLEHYAYVMARSIFERPSEAQREELCRHYKAMKMLASDGPYTEGIIAQHYAPRETQQVQAGERCFYTRENALIIDTLRTYIEREVPLALCHWCLAPLLVKASIHANTSGVFKGFHKANGLGCFGGKGGDALGRILKPITVDLPVWSAEPVKVHCSQLDVLKLIDALPGGIDLVYLDPPYVSAPYSSNYFMLNLIAHNSMPDKVSRVSGIPTDWTRSAFNYHDRALAAMKIVLATGLQKAKYLLISYSDEGLITPTEWQELLAPYRVEKREILYQAYKGCRNRAGRSGSVTELLYLVTVC